MPLPNHLTDNQFADLLEEMLFQKNTREAIYKKTKASEEKINRVERNVRGRWLNECSQNYDIASNLAQAEAEINYLLRLAYDSFLKSRKRKKTIYRNDVTNQKGPTIETHRIEDAGPGDVAFLKLASELVTKRISLTKIDKVDYNANDLDPELMMEFMEWKALSRRIIETGFKGDVDLSLFEEFLRWSTNKNESK
jgi:hypothetical protein